MSINKKNKRYFLETMPCIKKGEYAIIRHWGLKNNLYLRNNINFLLVKSSTSYVNIFSNKYFKASKHTFELNMYADFISTIFIKEYCVIMLCDFTQDKNMHSQKQSNEKNLNYINALLKYYLRHNQTCKSFQLLSFFAPLKSS